MAIQTRNKRDANFNTSSMSDLVFLLLIFFMLTSTLVSPNAIKLLLPQSKSKTIAKQTLNVGIEDQGGFYQYYFNKRAVHKEAISDLLMQNLEGQIDASVVLSADSTISIQHIVNVIDAVNRVNDIKNTKHKVILATSPKR